MQRSRKAILEGKIDVVGKHLDKDRDLIKRTSLIKVLRYAIEQPIPQLTRMVRLLIVAGARTNYVDESGAGLMHYAMVLKEPELVRTLYYHDEGLLYLSTLKPSDLWKSEGLPLFATDHPQMVDTMLQILLEDDFHFEDKNIALGFGIHCMHVELCRVLAKAVDVNEKLNFSEQLGSLTMQWSVYPLHFIIERFASGKNYRKDYKGRLLEIAKILIAAGARLDVLNDKGQTPIVAARQAGAVELATYFESCQK